MKKLLLLVVLTATTICWARPVSVNMSAAKAVGDNVKSHALKKTANVMDNFNLATQKGDGFQAGKAIYGKTEIIASVFIDGQIRHMGPLSNYNFTYEPISQSLFSISSSLYIDSTNEENLSRVGVVRYAKYVPGARLDVYSDKMWNVTYADYNTLNSPAPFVRHFFDNASIVVANPTGTTDPTQLKVAVTAAYQEVSPNTNPNTARKYSYNWLGVGTTANILDETLDLDISETPIDKPDVNVEGLYNFNNITKGQVAYLNGNPYALFFACIHPNKTNGSLDDSVATRYGFLSINLNNTDDVWDAIEKFQLLPPSIHNIFGATLLNPSASSYNLNTAAAINVDYDNNNNVYLAFNAVTYNTFIYEFFADSYKHINTPVVIKCPYTSDKNDLITSNITIDSMPIQVVADYVNSFGGLWDPEDNNTAPIFKLHFEGTEDDCPFIVSSEDNYSFLGTIMYVAENEYRIHIVEICSQNGEWRIRQVADITETFTFSDESKMAWYYNTDATKYIGYSKTIFDHNTANQFATSWIGSSTDIQISKTADGQYLIAKWREADKTKGDALPSPVLCSIQPYISQIANFDPFDLQLTTAYYSEIKLSYRRVDESVWSEPVSAAYGMHDSISFRGTFMPRIVPSLDEVLISYAYGAVQTQQQKDLYPLFRYNYASYQYSGIICASAKDGVKYIDYLSIKEEGPATANNLAVNPNPATNIANFRFSLLNPANTKLTIMNTLGQEVAVLVDEFCNASEYSLDYNVSELPAGTYYFTLTSGSLTQTKMFNVVR